MASPSHLSPQAPAAEPDPPNLSSLQFDHQILCQSPQSPQTLTTQENPDQTCLTHPQNQSREQDDEEGEEEADLQVLDQVQGMSTVSSPPPLPLTSPTHPPRRHYKRKKGAVNKKKQQAIEKKFQTLVRNLKPIPFVPAKTLDFDKHQNLLKRLALWDFVHIELDRNIRTDLVAELIVNYDRNLRCSYVNGLRINLTRPVLGRALKLPVKKDKCSSSTQEAVDLEVEGYEEGWLGFIDDFMSNWVLLHEDMWMMPNEVLNWTRVIKDGHPERVDWAGLVWFMVEKELMQGQELGNCYYASHLQYLIKSQREDLFRQEPKLETKEEEDVGPGKVGESDDLRGEELQDNIEVDEPDIELTLGKEMVEKEEVKFEDVMDVGESKEEDEEQKNWILDGKNSMGYHFLKPCNMGEDTLMDADEEKKIEEKEEDENERKSEENEEEETERKLEEEEEVVVEEEEGDEEEDEEEEDYERKLEEEYERRFAEGEKQRKEEEEGEGEEEEEEEEEGGGEGEEEDDDEEVEEEDDEEFSLTPKVHHLEGDGLTGNLLQGMETTNIPFSITGQCHDQSNMDILPSSIETHPSLGGPSILGIGSKREIGHGHDLLHDSLNGSNKKLRTDGSWGPKPSEFELCMDQVQHYIGKLRMIYEAKDQAAIDESNMNQQFFLAEIQRRDNVIEHLQKVRCEELQKKDGEIYKLERELFVMGNLLGGYRDALKVTQSAFSEYRQRCQLPEEPLYKDAGPGGLVLSTMELEKQRVKREEEDKLNRVIVEQKIKQFEEEFVGKLELHFNEVQMLDKRLLDFENQVGQLKEFSAKHKGSVAADSAPNE